MSKIQRNIIQYVHHEYGLQEMAYTGHRPNFYNIFISYCGCVCGHPAKNYGWAKAW